MNILITGGTGFIGSYVVSELVNGGHKVTVLARNPSKVKGFTSNSSIKIIEGTLYDNDIIQKALCGKDACIHIALGWGNTPVEMLEKDTKPSLFIFETAAKLGVKNLIYTSSTAAVGELREVMGESTHTRPVDFYGATKASTEAYLLSMSHTYNIRCNIIRPGYTFGNPVVDGAPMQPDSRFRDIVKSAKANEPINLVKNDGTQFIWAGDLAKLYSSLLESNLNRRIFFGLSTQFVTWEEVARYAVEYTGSKSKVIIEDKGWEKAAYMFDVSGMEKEFGLKFTAFDRIKEHIEYIADTCK